MTAQPYTGQPLCSVCFGTNVTNPGDVCEGCLGIHDFALQVEFPPDPEGHAAALARIAKLEGALKRLVAAEGGSWHPERYARTRAEALEEARAALAKRE